MVLRRFNVKETCYDMFRRKGSGESFRAKGKFDKGISMREQKV